MKKNTVVIKKIGVLSTAKIYGAIMAAIGLAIGLIWAFVALIAGTLLGAAAMRPGAGASIGGLIGVGMIIIFPLIYGVLGFIGGAVGALIYNLAAHYVGGIELEVEEK